MDKEAILEMDPNSECKIYFTFTEDWGHCYHQFKNKSNANVDPNKLPLLDDEYLGETGEPLENDDGQEVYDPTQEIHYDTCLQVEQIFVYTSKSFIGLIQKKIKELIDSDVLSTDSDDMGELLDALEVGHNPDAIMELFDSVGCDQYENVESNDGYDAFLWLTAIQLDDCESSFEIEEIK